MDGISPHIKDMLDMLRKIYLEDAERISARIESYKREYLIPLRSGVSKNELPDLEDLAEKYRDINSNPPQMVRIASIFDERTMEFIWRPQDIAIILGHDVSTTIRNLKILEGTEWLDRLKAVRLKHGGGQQRASYRYNEKIFPLLLSMYAHIYIKTRIVTPRNGQRLPPDEESAVWAYWDKICKTENPSGASAGITEGSGSLLYTDIVPPDGEDEERNLRSVIKDCAKMILDHKALSLALAFLANCADLFQNRSAFLFYLLPLLLLPILIYILKRLVSPLVDEERNKLTALCTYLLIALIVWAVIFTGRAINGDMSSSALRSMVERISSKMEEIEKRQESTAEKLKTLDARVEKNSEHQRRAEGDLKKLNTEIEKAAEARHQWEEGIVKRADDRIKEARTFVRQSLEDDMTVRSEDFERMLSLCNDSIGEIDKSCNPQTAAELMLARADIFMLYGMADQEAPFIKVEMARNSLLEVTRLKGASNAQLAEAYTSLGETYIFEGDRRSTREMARKAEDSYRNASKYINEASPFIKGSYYRGLGTLCTIKSEMLQAGNRQAQEEKRLLEKALEYFRKAHECVKDDPGSQKLIAAVINHEINIAKRKLANVALRLSTDKNNGTSEEIYRTAIASIKKDISRLDLEKEQDTYINLNLQNAKFNIELVDLIFNANMPDAAAQMNKQKVIEIAAECKQLLSDASNSIQQAEKFKRDGDTITSVQILMMKGTILKRYAIISGGDSETFNMAIKFYDAALKKLPERGNLNLNMMVAYNKAVILYETGLYTRSKEKIEETARLCELYLKNYSNTEYSETLDKFTQLLEQCRMWLDDN